MGIFTAATITIAMTYGQHYVSAQDEGQQPPAPPPPCDFSMLTPVIGIAEILPARSVAAECNLCKSGGDPTTIADGKVATTCTVVTAAVPADCAKPAPVDAGSYCTPFPSYGGCHGVIPEQLPAARCWAAVSQRLQSPGLQMHCGGLHRGRESGLLHRRFRDGHVRPERQEERLRCDVVGRLRYYRCRGHRNGIVHQA
jgi:hypothetical protein